VTSPGVEIAVGHPEEPPDDSPAVVGQRTIETLTLAATLAFALLMASDNWRTGIRWESTGPQAGYFPFWVSVIMAGACLFGLARELRQRGAPDAPFVRRNQFKRVLQVFVPTLLYVPVTQWLGLYVASFALIAGFMYFIGRIKPWKCVLTGCIFSMVMFLTFEVAFDVIMPKGPLERLFGF
jgi:putative tricarboxylic transport membrane protein